MNGRCSDAAPLADSLMPFCQAPQQFLLQLAQGGAPLARFRLHDEQFVLVCDPDAVYAVLNGSFDDYGKGDLYDIPRSTMGEGLITWEGEDWRDPHAMLAPLFARRRLRELEPLIVGCVQQQLAAWAQHGDSPIDLFPACKRFAFDVVSRGLLGITDDAVASALFATVSELDRIEALRVHYLARRFGVAATGNGGFAQSALGRACDRLDQLAFAIVEQRLAQALQSDDLLGAAISSTLVASLMPHEQRQFLRNLIVTMLIAGYATTGESVFWTLYLLARHPEVQQRTHAALQAHSLTPTQHTEHVAAPHTAAVRFDMPAQLSAVINESQRLYPPVWFMGRITRRPVQLCGVGIDADTRLLCSPLVLQRQPQLWPDASCFRPERFLPGAAASVVPRAFIPFGTGLRACIGRGLAMMELAALVGSAVQRFEFGLVSQREPVLTAAFSLQPREPVQFVLRPRA